MLNVNSSLKALRAYEFSLNNEINKLKRQLEKLPVPCAFGIEETICSKMVFVLSQLDDIQEAIKEKSVFGTFPKSMPAKEPVMALTANETLVIEAYTPHDAYVRYNVI